MTKKQIENMTNWLIERVHEAYIDDNKKMIVNKLQVIRNTLERMALICIIPDQKTIDKIMHDMEMAALAEWQNLRKNVG